MYDPIEINLPDGDWKCRWISDLYYSKKSKSISVKSRVCYETGSGDALTVSAAIQNMFMTIAGSRIRVKNSIVEQFYPNAQQTPERQNYTVQVDGKSLRASSKRLYRHLGLDGESYKEIASNKEFLRNVAEPLRMPDKFAYSQAHCIPNTDFSQPDAIDYFLIPSYEVLRYFFLHGNMLDEYLLSYFTGQGERKTQSLHELYVHPSGKPQIELDGMRRLAPLFIREGLSEAEVNCIGRIAFIRQAYDCLEIAKDSMMVAGLKTGDFAYSKLRTVFPQDKPFKMAVCGQRFRWQNKNYLLVDQIYETEEIMPFDQVVYMPLVDHRSQAHIPEQDKKVQRPRAAPRTIPGSPSTRTENKAGNTDQPVHLTNFLLTKSFFEKSIEPPLKLEKEGQTVRYQSRAIADIAQYLISVSGQAQAQADAGRGKGHRKDVAHHRANERQPTALFKAIGQLRGYKCSYFNLDQEIPSFNYRFYLNNQRGLDKPYDIVLCRLEPRNSMSKASIYLLWANAIRYAIFYAPALRQLSWANITDLCTNYFGKAGVYAFGKDGKFGVLAEQMRGYDRHNQLDKSADELTDKIGDELDNIFDDHAAKFR